MKILSFGEIIWDVYSDGAFIGGAPLNLAAHAALQGADAWAVSAVGDDELGKKAFAKVKELGVKTEYIGISDKTTGKCLVTLDENSIPSYNVLENTAYDYIDVPVFKDGEEFDILAFGTLALRGENNIKTLKKLIDMKISDKIYSDLNIRPPFYSERSIRFCLENAHIVKISDEELPTVLEMIDVPCTDTENAMKILSEKYPQLEYILITCGDKGAYCYDTDNIYFVSATKTDVASTVGAGDSFGATFLVELLKGKTIPECLNMASRVSAFVVSQSGAVPYYDIKSL